MTAKPRNSVQLQSGFLCRLFSPDTTVTPCLKHVLPWQRSNPCLVIAHRAWGRYYISSLYFISSEAGEQSKILLTASIVFCPRKVRKKIVASDCNLHGRLCGTASCLGAMPQPGLITHQVLLSVISLAPPWRLPSASHLVPENMGRKSHLWTDSDEYKNKKTEKAGRFFRIPAGLNSSWAPLSKQKQIFIPAPAPPLFLAHGSAFTSLNMLLWPHLLWAL